MAFARCQQVDGRIGLRIDLTTQPTTDVEDIAAGVLGRRPSRAELKTLNTVGRGPGGLHAMRRLLGRAWMVTQAAGRDAIEAHESEHHVRRRSADETPPSISRSGRFDEGAAAQGTALAASNVRPCPSLRP